MDTFAPIIFLRCQVPSVDTLAMYVFSWYLAPSVDTLATLSFHGTWHHHAAASKNSPLLETVFMTQILLSACELGRLLFFFSGHADQQVNQGCINQRDKELKGILCSDHRKERPCRHGAVKSDQNEHRSIDQLA